jgi:hypothetical protein
MDGFSFVVSPAWASAYANAVVGVLALGNVVNPPESASLEERKAA